ADLSGRRTPATLVRRLSAIAVQHRQAGLPFERHHPAIADVLAGLARLVGTAPAQKEALSTAELTAMVAVLPRHTAGLRDRALLLLGFAGAFRRSELAALTVADLAFTSEGLEVRVRRRKEDPLGRGAFKGIPFGG